MSIHEDRIYHCPTDRKHATALYGTRRDVSTPSIFGYSMGLELSQLGRRDGTRGWRNSAELREQVWDKTGQEGEERNAKRKTTWEICHQKGTGNNVTNGRPLSYVRGNV